MPQRIGNNTLNLHLFAIYQFTHRSMRKYYLFIPFLFAWNLSFAQNAPGAYQNAISLLNSADYQSAIPFFEGFTNQFKYGNLANYASFHLAEIYLKLNQPEQAIFASKQVALKDWSKTEESKYVLGLAYFQNQQNLEALRVFKWIKQAEIIALAESASFEHLKSAPVAFLIAHLEEFKENEGYRSVLKSKLAVQSFLSTTEKITLVQLNKKIKSSGIEVSKDQVLDVVLILPFTNTNTNSISSLSNTDFLIELYQGLSFGVSKLKDLGEKINLITFDSRRDIAYLQALLKDPAIADADVIIGPVYPEESDLVSAFAEEKKIPFINPLSNIGDRFTETGFSYLFRPSIASLSLGIVDAIQKVKWGKKVAIGYSSSSKDEKLGMLVQEKLISAGYQVTKFQKIDAKNVSSFLKTLGISRGSNPNVDQVILLTDDPSIAQPIFGLMESISTSVPLLVMDSWLGFNFANYEMLEFPNFYFISNNTPRFGTKEMQDFREEFLAKNLIYPSINSMLGYDLINWLKSNLSMQMGIDFRRSLDIHAFQVGKFSWGYNFRESNNNQYVPVFQLESGELKPIE